MQSTYGYWTYFTVLCKETKTQVNKSKTSFRISQFTKQHYKMSFVKEDNRSVLVSEPFQKGKCLKLSPNVASILSINGLGETVFRMQKFKTEIHFLGLELLMD